MDFAVRQAVKAGGVSGVLIRQKDGDGVGDAWQVQLSDGRKVWHPCRDLEAFAFGETVARPPDSRKQAPKVEPVWWHAHLQKHPPKPGMFTCCAVRPKSRVVPPVAASTPRSTKATAGTSPSLAERRAAEKAARASADAKRSELQEAEPAMEEEAAAQAARDATSTCMCIAVTQAWHDSRQLQHVACPRLPEGLTVLTRIKKTDGYTIEETNDQVEWAVVIQALVCGQCGRRFRSEATKVLSAPPSIDAHHSGVGQGWKLRWTPLVAPAAARHAELAAELAELEAVSGPKLWSGRSELGLLG